jgi:hypothetical protein
MIHPRERRAYDSEKANQVSHEVIPKYIDEMLQTGHIKDNSPLGLEMEIMVDEAIFGDQLKKKQDEIQFATTLPVNMSFDSSLDVEQARKIQQEIRSEISKNKLRQNVFPK